MRDEDWIDSDLRYWGDQMRWIHLGKDGWPSRSMLGKLIDEHVVGAGCVRIVQHCPECLDSRALQMNRLVKSLSEEDQTMLFVHYVVHGKGKMKAWRLGWPARTYWYRLERAKKHYGQRWYTLRTIGQKVATEIDGSDSNFRQACA